MKHEAEREITRDEVRKEFQLERMTLFSDAVFAIVITLMAIEIRLPEEAGHQTGEELMKAMLHLFPVVLAYIVSFAFIGTMWYTHLQLFSLLKDYDKGLVVRNLVLLFFIGLFPFCASLVGKIRSHSQVPLFAYLGIIFACLLARFVLQHYIFIKRPGLRINTNIDIELVRHKRDRFMLVLAFIVFLLICITNTLVDADYKSLAPLWTLVIPLALRFYKKREQAA